MKKIVILFSFILIFPFSAFSQGFYFDIGLGADYNISTIIYNEDDLEDSYFTYFGNNIGLKAGYGPFKNAPVFFVFGYENIYGPIGPGVLYYPIPFIQLGLSFGFPIDIFSGNFGFAWDTSIAFDFGKKNHGVLLGIKYWGLTQKQKEFLVYKDRIVNNAFGLFVKYVYRKKLI